MNNQKKQKIKEIIKYVGVTIGFLIIILGIFLLLKIEIINFMLLLILIDLILVIWKMILEGDYKK